MFMVKIKSHYFKNRSYPLCIMAKPFLRKREYRFPVYAIIGQRIQIGKVIAHRFRRELNGNRLNSEVYINGNKEFDVLFVR